MSTTTVRTFPIAEIFFSVQGEGGQSGMPMIFLRLAGCNVGKPYSTYIRETMGLEVFQHECTIFDGRKFPCDTNYNMTQRAEIDEIIGLLKKEHPTCRWVSITGGEPLMHDGILELVEALHAGGFYVHLETSGTIPDIVHSLFEFDYSVVSPKQPFIDQYVSEADEIRFLVDSQFDWDKLPPRILFYPDKIWISPVNECNSINPENAKLCMDILSKHPEVRLSMQIHKTLGVR